MDAQRKAKNWCGSVFSLHRWQGGASCPPFKPCMAPHHGISMATTSTESANAGKHLPHKLFQGISPLSPEPPAISLAFFSRLQAVVLSKLPTALLFHNNPPPHPFPKLYVLPNLQKIKPVSCYIVDPFFFPIDLILHETDYTTLWLIS